MPLAGLCGQRRCQCSFASDSIRISGSGEPGDPLTFEAGPIAVANLAARPANPQDGDHILQLDTKRHYWWDALVGAWVPYGFTPWTSVTPTFQNVTQGTGASLIGRYRWEGDALRFRGTLEHGTSPSWSGEVQLNVPLGLSLKASITEEVSVGAGHLSDAGVRNYELQGRHTVAADTYVIFVHTETGNLGILGGTSLITVAVGDTLAWDLLLEVE